MEVENSQIERETDLVVEGLSNYVTYLNAGLTYFGIMGKIKCLEATSDKLARVIIGNKNKLYESLPIRIRGRLLEEEYQRSIK